MSQQTLSAFLLSIALAAPIKLIQHAHQIPNALGFNNKTEQTTYRNLLSTFVYNATHNPPPEPVKTPADVSQTCIYLNSAEGLPLPIICVQVLRELNTCHDTQKPTIRCYTIIGANKP